MFLFNVWSLYTVGKILLLGNTRSNVWLITACRKCKYVFMGRVIRIVTVHHTKKQMGAQNFFNPTQLFVDHFGVQRELFEE